MLFQVLDNNPRKLSGEGPEMLLQVSLPNKQLFRLGEVAEFCDVHEHTVRRWIDEGLLPSLIVGKQLRISRYALGAFIKKKA